MQTDQERRCSACGADNKQGASFCWRCYAPFESTVTARAVVAASIAAGP